MIAGIVALGLRGCVEKAAESRFHSSEKSADERLVFIDGHSMLLHAGALGDVMTGWLQADRQRTLNFELSESCFISGSSALSPVGKVRALQVAGLASKKPEVMVHVLVPAAGAKSTGTALNDERAAVVRDQLVAHGVIASHVRIEPETEDLPTAKSLQLAILLTK